ncbi:hypothetical protein TrLO_g14626 [Triparma laevis f. longispina]|uniref:Peptide deformylase n=1 Tax=Triparma laevis f. longispina TaxID=1714387 RepID=A0A9W7FKY3_9STRA|nr:hypothetical protein TrLO_g14626 [Triparma laevis f. longispina]
MAAWLALKQLLTLIIAYNSTALKTLASKLKSTCKAEKAVGLAAQQCGVDASIVYLEEPSSSSNTFLINPQIVKRSPETEMKPWTEFCLVLPPSLKIELLRDSSVTVEYNDLTGERGTRTFTGELSRAVQHEMDHDRGILIVDHSASLTSLPPWIASLEADSHDQRQAVAFRRSVACGVECQDRRKLAKQSRTNTKRQDVLDLSRQRSRLYGTSEKAVQCPPPPIPCI